MKKIECDPSSLAGDIDERVVNNLSERYGRFDPSYLKCMESCHGGTPNGCKVIANNKPYKVARFLTLVDHKSTLSQPFRPDVEDSREDERVVNSIDYMLDGEHSTARSLFSGLVPFAATSADGYLHRCAVNLFCFDHRNRLFPPPVVLWDAKKALDHSFIHEDLPIEEAFNDAGDFINVDYDSFLVPVADSFEDFANMISTS